MDIFNVTGDNIHALNDTDLRTLVGLLCEADLTLQGIPTAGVTYGGSQTAPDGGLDVRVEVSSTVKSDGFIPKSITGYQVKKPDMPASAIKEEMRPSNVPRPVIVELANQSGAYIIVSSSGSTADKPLTDRRTAMSDALSGIANASNLKVDFYDRTRVASWVNCHPSLVLWVKSKIGLSVQGWQAFGSWAYRKAEANEAYLLDEDVRLHHDGNQKPEGMSAIDGIHQLRATLSSTTSIRLVGLSGVGKTRLVQALFDERIGVNALPNSQVCYTDMSDSPNPAPVAFAEQLLTLKKPIILIIDNCPPDLHKRLTEVCTTSGSLVKLLTVEYDVRDDQPEETNVFRLEAASTALIEKIIQIRFKHISQIDARTIAEFSGGNARIAIALANTVTNGQSLANLKDEDLFKRLFHQRNDPNDSLMKSAEVCALVYSFDAETTDSPNELSLLAYLAEVSRSDLHRSVAELKRRDLVQQRSVWRAVLPHALANRLAKQALENIPLNTIRETFEQNERLLTSFSRRLSYLHDSPQAIQISKQWLSEQGLLGDVSRLNTLGITLLKNIAPVNPEATLEAIERAVNGENGQYFISNNNQHFRIFSDLLRSLAYDSDLFDRSVAILCRFALIDTTATNNTSNASNVLKPLFFLYLSGTHASALQRLAVIEQLIQSTVEQEQNLGISLLGVALEAYHFSSHHPFDFGARSRDCGYQPKTQGEVRLWFAEFIAFTVTIAISTNPISEKVKTLLADKFRSLWCFGSVFDELETAAKILHEQSAWHEGWGSVKETLYFDGKRMDAALLARLQALANHLAPDTLLEKVRAYVFSGGKNGLTNNYYDANNDLDYEKLEQMQQALGRDVAIDESVFKIILPELVTVTLKTWQGNGIFGFARGLAEKCLEPLVMWDEIFTQFLQVDESKRNLSTLRGFIYEISLTRPEILETILDNALKNKQLEIYFPHLQIPVKIDERGVERLKQSLHRNISPAWTYQSLANGRAHESINDENLCELLRLIASKPDGLAVAIDILSMRFHGVQNCSSVIAALGRELLVQVNYDNTLSRNTTDGKDYNFAQIANKCLIGADAIEASETICRKLISQYGDYPDLIKVLAKHQPIAFLNSGIHKNSMIGHRDNSLSEISDSIILDWCNDESATRYPEIAQWIKSYQHNATTDSLELTPLVLTIIENAPNVTDVLSAFRNGLYPSMWSGSYANILQQYLPLIVQLKSHPKLEVSTWAYNEERAFIEKIEQQRKWENARESINNERFEW